MRSIGFIFLFPRIRLYHPLGRGIARSPGSIQLAENVKRMSCKGGLDMPRKYIDCRDYPGEVKCTLALSADTEDELVQAVVQHGTAVHGYEDTPEFRQMVR